MREDVLSLRAMGGDPVSEEYLKAELYHRAEALKDIPDAPLFFGRLDYAHQHGASQHGASQHGASQHGASQHGASQHGASQHGTDSAESGCLEPDSPHLENPKLENPELEYPEPDRPGTTTSRGTAFTSAAGMCTRRTARPP